MPMRRGANRAQRGAFLVMTAILIVVLIGIAALVLDFGRVVALRAEMQNAVDAAALAGAAELDGKSNARLRARAAARNALIHDSRYARVAGLLGEKALPDGAFDFFCIIGSKYDVKIVTSGEQENRSIYCPGGTETPTGSGEWKPDSENTPDKYAHYIRVRLDPALATDAAGRFTVDLIFLPVLRVFGLDPLSFVSLKAMATAGRHFYACNYPPMMICDPFEGTGQLRNMLSPGQLIVLRDQGGKDAKWTAGNFGFLSPVARKNGKKELAEELGNPAIRGCSPPTIVPEGGQGAAPTMSGINTRFDMYEDPIIKNHPNPPEEYPPDVNIFGYPAFKPANAYGEDFVTAGGFTDRFGNGQWDFDGWWVNAAKRDPATKPNGWSNSNRPKRWDVYQWEVSQGKILARPELAHRTYALPERRLLHIAVASCKALGIKGGGDKSYALMSPDGFAKMFLIHPAGNPGGKEQLRIVAEYIGWAEETDANYHVDIQLYQ